MTSPTYRRSAFVFRRDLRLPDNTGLARAAVMSEEVLPCFVFDPVQCDPERNDYFSAPAFQVLLESLEDLDGQLSASDGRLYRFRGAPDEVLAELIDEHEVEAVFVNRDYTPFSRERDGRIQAACAARQVPFHRSHDLLLTHPGQVLTGGGTPYKVYTPFARAARQEEVPEPTGPPRVTWARPRIDTALPQSIYDELLPERRELAATGGREAALSILRKLDRYEEYESSRNVPADEGGTTGLSLHHKLGTVSIRETFHAVADALGKDHELIGELYWRDFFTQLAWFEPRVFGHAFRPEYEAIEWEDDGALFEAWTEGRTGFPLVDAGMRQLRESGFLHNRVRMVVASFLVKDLHVDWRRGERWFARRLLDYDPSVNNGNWQWAASTGADAQPYFRIFNPWSQQRKHDPDCEYVKRWVPELRDLDAKTIHGLEKGRPDDLADLDYPEPVVDHKARAKRAKELFQQAR